MPVARRVAVVALVLAYAWWAVSLPPFSAIATAAVLAAGAAACLWGGRRPRAPRRAPDPDLTGTVGWALLAVAASAWQLAAYVQHPRADHPTLSALANAALASQPARAAAFVVWLGGAAWLSRR